MTAGLWRPKLRRGTFLPEELPGVPAGPREGMSGKRYGADAPIELSELKLCPPKQQALTRRPEFFPWLMRRATLCRLWPGLKQAGR